MKKINVCILFGGVSTEHEVSLTSASSVLSNIDREKYEVTMLGITKGGRWLLYDGSIEKIASGEWERDPAHTVGAWISPSRGDKAIHTEDGRTIDIDVVFPVMHGANCEDGTLQGLFALADIPFVGSDCESSAVCMDKAATKTILNNFDIPQAKAVIVERTWSHDLERIYGNCEELGYPLFVKPSRAGSSVGVSKVRSRSELESALSEAFSIDRTVLIEEFIKGREVEVAVMGNEDPVASVCGEIDPGSDFYDYETKYISDTASYYIPARIDDECSEKVREYAVKIYKILGCKGLSRVDFFVGDRIIFNEINTLPGFTSISMFPKLFMYGGMSYSEIIDKLIALALKS